MKYCAIFKNVTHSLEPGETPSDSQGSKLCTTFLNIARYGEITKKFTFTGTGVSFGSNFLVDAKYYALVRNMNISIKQLKANLWKRYLF